MSDSNKRKKRSQKTEKKVEEVLEELSSEEEVQTISRVGYMEMKKNKTWKAVHCLIIGGSFYWSKKNQNNKEPLGGVDMTEAEIEKNVEVQNKKCFALKVNDEVVFTGYVAGSSSLDAWVKCLEDSSKEEPQPFPISTGKVKKRKLVERAGRGVVSKTAASALGKKVMKAIVNEETTGLLNALKKIVKKESGSSKKADDLEKNIIKIAVKAYLLSENKKVQNDDFLKANKPLREAFEVLIKCFNHRPMVISSGKLVENLARAENLIRQAEEIITNILTPHLSPKNMFKLSEAFGTIANVEFLEKVFLDETMFPELEKLIDAMEYYTQFHYD